MEIKRYGIVGYIDGKAVRAEAYDGTYVLYSDHLAALAAAQKVYDSLHKSYEAVLNDSTGRIIALAAANERAEKSESAYKHLFEGYKEKDRVFCEQVMEAKKAYNPEFITAHILRHWDRDKIEKFALHLLGDDYQEMKAENAALKDKYKLLEKVLGESRVALDNMGKNLDKLDAENVKLKSRLAGVKHLIATHLERNLNRPYDDRLCLPPKEEAENRAMIDLANAISAACETD